MLDILKTVKLSMLQTQSFEPRDVVDVLKCLPEKDLLEQLEVYMSCCMLEGGWVQDYIAAVCVVFSLLT